LSPGCTATAAFANADFSPADEYFPFPADPRSARLRQAISELGSDCEFRDGVAPLTTLGISVAFKTIQRVSEATGTTLVEELHGAAAGLSSCDESPDNPPELLVIQGDGMRLRERLEPGASDKHDGWRECKVGIVARCLKGWHDSAGNYHDPETLLQTGLATLDDVHLFGPRLRAEAERKGLRRAGEVVVVSDAGHGLPGLWREHFPGCEWILDFAHTAGRLSACAAAICAQEKRRHKLFHRLKGLLFAGKMEKLMNELIDYAKTFARRPEALSQLPEESAARILWTHNFYVETYREHMDYPRYRLRGWPIASGHVEAACKRIGTRMKGANKRWTREGAEAIAAIIAARACGDNRWAQRWPAPILAA
jgi:hypothetical protein